MTVRFTQVFCTEFIASYHQCSLDQNSACPRSDRLCGAGRGAQVEKRSRCAHLTLALPGGSQAQPAPAPATATAMATAAVCKAQAPGEAKALPKIKLSTF